MRVFEFLLPNSKKKKIEYDESTDRLQVVNEILNEKCFNIPKEEINFYIENNISLPETWNDYLNACWVYQSGKIDPNRKNHEDKVKLMFNCITAFLDNGKVADKTNNDEISLEYIKNPYKTRFDSNNLLLGIQKDKETYENSNKMNIKRYKQSKTYKFKRIFNKRDVKKQEHYKLKNKDVYGENELINIKIRKQFTDEEFIKWLEKPAKNVFNKNVFAVVYKIYKGWQGVIDANQPYKSKWCYVWSDGTFEFDRCKYKINIEEVKQYQDIRKDKYYKDEKGWSMDTIYCVEQHGKLHFWDMNINKIDNEYIVKLV